MEDPEISSLLEPEFSPISGAMKDTRAISLPSSGWRNIRKAFGATLALDDVSFDLRQGEVRALLGENGAGKSTLVKILSGAIKPDSGTMAIGDVRLCSFRPPRRPKAGHLDDLPGTHSRPPSDRWREHHARPGSPRRPASSTARTMRARVREALDFVHHPEITPDIPGPAAERRGQSRSSRSPAPSCTGRGSWSWTSRRARSPRRIA